MVPMGKFLQAGCRVVTKYTLCNGTIKARKRILDLHSWPWLAHPLGTVGDAIYPVAYDLMAYERLTMGRQLPRICMDCN